MKSAKWELNVCQKIVPLLPALSLVYRSIYACMLKDTHKAKVEASSSFSSADVLFCKANQDTLRDKQERLDPPFNSSDTFTIGIAAKAFIPGHCGMVQTI